MPSYSILSANALNQIQEKNSVILDVRTRMEHKGCHLQRPHELVPLDELDPEDFARRRGLAAGMDLYILCRSGARARVAAEKFVAAGYPNVHVIDGGILACRGCGEPVAGGPKQPLFMHRVFMYILVIVGAIGLILALAGHPAALGLPLLAGMAFAYRPSPRR